MTFGVLTWSVVLAFVVALALGGDLRNLTAARIRYWWLLALALALKLGLIIFHAPGGLWLQPLVFVLIGAALVVNWRLPGVAVVAVGFLLNVAVTTGNGGTMPFLPSAAVLAGRGPDDPLVRGQGNAFGQAEGDDTRMRWLDDRIPFPPTKQLISIGDIAIMAGGVWLVIGLTKPSRLRLNQQA